MFTEHYRDGKCALPRPATLPLMLEAAASLSEGFPEVRVDFYEAGGKLYFGEMTFASLCGKMDFYTPAFLKELGDQVVLDSGGRMCPAQPQTGTKGDFPCLTPISSKNSKDK